VARRSHPWAVGELAARRSDALSLVARMASLRTVVIAVLAVAGVHGCGDGDQITTVKGLPSEQGMLVFGLCPTRGEMPVAEASTRRRRARAELRALDRAYRENPEARVTTSYTEAETLERKRETTTVRRLVQLELLSVPELLETGDAASRACARRVEGRLRALLAER
jgi:hypothetical protein